VSTLYVKHSKEDIFADVMEKIHSLTPSQQKLLQQILSQPERLSIASKKKLLKKSFGIWGDDILIDHLRKERKALEFLALEIEKGSLLFTSVISRVEILAGMRKGEEGAINSLFKLMTPIDANVTIANRAGCG